MSFDYVCTYKSEIGESTFKIQGSTDKELTLNTLLEILLEDKSCVSVQDIEGTLGFFRSQYIKECTAKLAHAL